VVPGYDPNQFRKDSCGAWMKRSDYGQTTGYGWEIDHVKPVAVMTCRICNRCSGRTIGSSPTVGLNGHVRFQRHRPAGSVATGVFGKDQRQLDRHWLALRSITTHLATMRWNGKG
jgi:hypothetical protein